MNDIVERLRADAESTDDIGLCADAASEIERLRELLAEAYADADEVLRPRIKALERMME